MVVHFSVLLPLFHDQGMLLVIGCRKFDAHWSQSLDNVPVPGDYADNSL